MKNKLKKISILITITFGLINAQNQLIIPETISGNEFNLSLQYGSTQLLDGNETQTMGANGGNLAPTLIFQKGEYVNINVTNNLDEETTIHWHGMHITPQNDGGPHSVIMPGDTWNPNFTVMDKACTMWYHPHLHEKTNEHVTKGITGFLIIKDDEEALLNLPRTYGVDDIPLNLQTKQFDNSNQIVIGEHVDSVPMANSTVDAFVELPAQVVRLRLLNGSSMRVFNLGFSNNATFYQIGSDGGLLSEPVSMTRLLLGPAERAEILVDLNGMNGDSFELKSFGSSLPGSAYGVAGLATMQGTPPPEYNSNPLNGCDFTLLEINVGEQNNNPVTSIPNSLVTVTPLNEADATVTRSLTIQAPDMMNNGVTGPFEFNGESFNMSVINQVVQLGDTEIWEIFNMSMVAHPFHIHDVQFYILDRDGVIPPENERGRKDVVLIKDMETVRFIAKFEDHADNQVPYMYHCHMLQHEDEGLIGQFIVEGEEILFGDVNFDGTINILDVISTVGHILGTNPLTPEQLVVADLDQDGIVNIIDIIQIVNIILDSKIELIEPIANLQQNELSVSGSVGGIQFMGELLSSINGNDIVQTANGITLIYNMNGKLETELFELSENSTDFVVSSSMGKEVELQTVSQFAILDNYPNPFNPSTTISYQLNQSGQININIFDLNGKLIDELVNDYKEMGNYSINWNGSNLANGVYIVKLHSNEFTEMKKITLLK
ncbi:MAG: multicopper oxidase domain-containing protein [Candidatus Marinimicrobia bacterium]|nr:multicopper oxidase domain-containing protein [Candidatus Neomarinimicrobiota bacterium]